MAKSLPEGHIAIDTSWYIKAPAGEFLARCAEDLRDYFAVSMDLPLTGSAHAIEYGTDSSLTDGAYRIDASAECIRLIGADERAAAQAGYLLEDLCNLAESPFVKSGVTERKPIFRCRMIHSGYAEDVFPDGHLNAIAHAGINAILLFTRGVNQASTREIDFNELIGRAAKFGIDVYAYSYMKSRMHPEDEGAEAFYDGLYGDLFRRCPGLAGIVFVGESVEFPSHDERTSGMLRLDNMNPDGTKKVNKPNPGWFPCRDYPQWLNMVKRIIRREKPDADIVFWSYNWGRCEEADRIALIDSLPTDISLQATFEMFEDEERQGVPTRSADYTASIPGPGKYFLSEAKAAARRGIPLYSMTNSGGLTWDVGVVPYEPCPYQWLKRYNAMRECHAKYGLCGSMDSHHFGFYPSFISDLAKVMFTDPEADGEAVIDALIIRDWDEAHLCDVRRAYRLFSDALNDFIISNYDQYGPLRIGPAYPMVREGEENVHIPAYPGAHFGGDTICHPQYRYPVTPAGFREKLAGEIRVFKTCADRFLEGAAILQAIVPKLPEAKRAEAARIAGVGAFMGRTALTTHHVKRWRMARENLRVGYGDADALRAELDAVEAAERANAEAALMLVDADSRLGYEPSMEYIGSRTNIEWKLGLMGKR